MFADKIIYSNAVFSAKDKDCQPFNGGIAINGDRIVAVGSKDELKEYINKDTQIIECGANSLLMPAFNDGHQHIRETIAAINGVPLRHVESEEECIENAIIWEKKHSDTSWVYGFGWHFSNWKVKNPPNNKLLSKAFPNKPVCLVDIDYHAAWLNEAALEKLGITKDSPNPPSSIISRFEDGTPTGYVQEMIVFDVADIAMADMEKTEENRKKYFKKFLNVCNKHGLTGVSDMGNSEPQWLDLYEVMSAQDQLSCRINLTHRFLTDDYLDVAEKLSKRFPNSLENNVCFYGIKSVLDGVGMGYTSWQLNPFNDNPNTTGFPMLPEEELREKTLKTLKAGYHMHIHACGDKSVRKSLDWYEEAKELGILNEKQRYTITHNDTVDPEDIARYSKLGVIASMQPDMLAPSLKWEDNIYPRIFGEKLCETSWPCKSLIDAGTTLAFSTDSPIGPIDPMYNIYRAVTRKHSDGLPKEGWNPHQKISLSNALWAYTYGNAYQFGKEDYLGTLEVGKKADVTVLNKNLFVVEPEDYFGTEAMLTIFNGKVVYKNM